MNVRAFTGGPLRSVGYLVYAPSSVEALAVDTPIGSAHHIKSLLSANQLRLRYLVNTHGHWDHIAEAAEVAESTGAALCAHTWDAMRLSDPALTVPADLSIKLRGARATLAVSDGSVLVVGPFRFEVLHTPGHTPGSICLHEKRVRVLFSGDTLLHHAVGSSDLPGGNPQHLARSLTLLATLPDDTRVYPGHGPPTTVGAERWLLELAQE